MVSCSVPQRVDHGLFVEGQGAGWGSKGALQVCFLEVAAEEAGVIRWVSLKAGLGFRIEGLKELQYCVLVFERQLISSRVLDML